MREHETGLTPGRIVSGERLARPVEYADEADLGIGLICLDRLLRSDRIVEVDRGCYRRGKHLRGDHRLAVASGSEAHLVLEDNRNSAREYQERNQKDREGSGAPFEDRSLQNRHFWFTPIASASSRELIVRPRD